MSYLINNQQKVNEIIFADRNKAYGAYQLRSEYGATLLKSIGIVAFTIFSTFGIAYYYANKVEAPVIETKQISPDCIVREIDLTKKDIIAEVKPREKNNPQPARNNPSSNAAASTVIKDTNAVVTKTTALNTDIGPTNTNTTSGTPGDLTLGSGSGSGTGTSSTTIIDYSEPVIIADKAPEFEGGLAALYRFIASKIKYPSVASGEGIEGTVHVKFVVDEKGKVCNLSLQNKKGYGLDEEALRVVAMIPNFKSPGMMGTKPVKVYYQLPIKFRLR